MRFRFLIILVIFSSVILACRHHRENRPPVFATPFGEIQKGAPRALVMSVLGNPRNIKQPGIIEIWHYYFGQNDDSFVYFVNGKVIDIRDSQGKSTLIEQKP